MANAFEEAFATFIAGVLRGSPKYTDRGQTADLEDVKLTYKWRLRHPHTGKQEWATITATPKFPKKNKVRFVYKIVWPDGKDETRPDKPLNSHKVELNILGALWDIFDGKANKVKDNDKDGLSVPLKKILRVIKNRKPKNFKEFAKELRKDLNVKEQTAFDKILGNHGLK